MNKEVRLSHAFSYATPAHVSVSAELIPNVNLLDSRFTSLNWEISP